MSRDINDPSRRRFLRTGTLALAAATSGALLTSRRGRAAGLPRVREDSPMAQTLQYHHDASAVQSGAHQQGAVCGNCQLFTAGDASWGKCSVFPGKLVNSSGWCSAWVKGS